MTNKKIEVLEEIETTLFYTEELNAIIYNIFEDMERLSFKQFKENFLYTINNDYENRIKWELVKNYADIDKLQQANFETIKKDFLKDIETIIKWG